jgi:branched-chain amino acid transport system permease protein
MLGYKYAAFGNYFLALGLLALATAVSIFVIHSPLGTAFAALRDNTTYAVARGVGRFKYQLRVFAASACFTGLAGAVYAGYFTVMGADKAQSGVVAAAVLMVIGGLGTVWGPIVGAATLTRLLGLGLILILFTIFWPTGIVGVIEALLHASSPRRNCAAASRARVARRLSLRSPL